MGVIQGSINQFLTLAGLGTTALNRAAQAELETYSTKQVASAEAQAKERHEGFEKAYERHKEGLTPAQQEEYETKEAGVAAGATEDIAELKNITAEGKLGGAIGATKAKKQLENLSDLWGLDESSISARYASELSTSMEMQERIKRNQMHLQQRAREKQREEIYKLIRERGIH